MLCQSPLRRCDCGHLLRKCPARSQEPLHRTLARQNTCTWHPLPIEVYEHTPTHFVPVQINKSFQPPIYTAVGRFVRPKSQNKPFERMSGNLNKKSQLKAGSFLFIFKKYGIISLGNARRSVRKKSILNSRVSSLIHNNLKGCIAANLLTLCHIVAYAFRLRKVVVN